VSFKGECKNSLDYIYSSHVPINTLFAVEVQQKFDVSAYFVGTDAAILRGTVEKIESRSKSRVTPRPPARPGGAEQTGLCTIRDRSRKESILYFAVIEKVFPAPVVVTYLYPRHPVPTITTTTTVMRKHYSNRIETSSVLEADNK
jgi:hypothetical protein